MMEGNELKDFLRDLVEFLKANDIAEFGLEQTDFKVRMKFAGEPAPAPAAAPQFDIAQMARMFAASGAAASVGVAPVSAPASSQAQVAHMHASGEGGATASAAVPQAAPVVKHHIVKSPIVGTMYEAASPGSPPFVKIGDIVEVGQVLCIVEAMKLMNEIESDMAGEVMERIAQSGQPVEYGQPLFAIKAK